ncbi:head GIN domain-containing protein [Chryseolinea sp. T2]|uniref:head GIN domain-containing protein n=1 Tax=Chryseolinea sp. T2 TaxID=3129255 RepID=UPI003076DD4F
MKYFATCLMICMIVSSAVVGQSRQTKNVDTFTKISFRVPGKMYVRQGSPQKVEIEGDKDALEKTIVKVEGSKLIVGREGKWSNWNFGDDDEVNVYVTVKDVNALNVSGSGDIIVETKIVTNELELNVSGSGNLKVEAEVSGPMEADVSGSGDLDVKGRCASLNSDVSGSGKVTAGVTVSKSAEFGVSGSGKVEASGSASDVRVSISGSGKVLASNMQTNTCNVRISGSGDVEISVKNEIDANITGSGSVRYRGEPSKVNSHATGSGSVRKM